MAFITGRSIPRRTFLRGGAVALGLPFLDAMVPAGRVWARAATQLDNTRLVCLELVHGAAGGNEWGATQNLWDPAGIGREFDLAPTALSPLEPFRDYLTIISNTDVKMAEAVNAPEVGGDHPRSSATFL